MSRTVVIANPCQLEEVSGRLVGFGVENTYHRIPLRYFRYALRIHVIANLRDESAATGARKALSTESILPSVSQIAALSLAIT